MDHFQLSSLINTDCINSLTTHHMKLIPIEISWNFCRFVLLTTLIRFTLSPHVFEMAVIQEHSLEIAFNAHYFVYINYLSYRSPA